MHPSLRRIRDSHLKLIVERLRLVRDQRVQVGHQRFADGFRAALESVGRRPLTPWEGHAQIKLRDIEVDEQIASLLSVLWNLGFETRFSCQGHLEHYVGHLVGTHDAHAYIAFVDLEQGAKFMTETIDLLGYVPWAEGPMACVPMVPTEDGVIHSAVRFPPGLLEDITRVWSSRAATMQVER